MNVLLNSRTGDLTLTVDKETKVTSLKPYTQYDDFSRLLDWSKYSSAIYFGGKNTHMLAINLNCIATQCVISTAWLAQMVEC